MSGKAPDQVFNVECRSELLQGVAKGQGGNRRVAEQIAATRALELLGDAGDDVNDG
jgi:dsRNA-specific ribonuclease